MANWSMVVPLEYLDSKLKIDTLKSESVYLPCHVSHVTLEKKEKSETMRRAFPLGR